MTIIYHSGIKSHIKFNSLWDVRTSKKMAIKLAVITFAEDIQIENVREIKNIYVEPYNEPNE